MPVLGIVLILGMLALVAYGFGVAIYNAGQELAPETLDEIRDAVRAARAA